MEEREVSLSQYMKMYHIGYKEVKRMIDNKELDARQTEGGNYKIKIGGNTVSREIYEAERERRIEAETKLKLARRILEGGEINENS